ncbi:hypothetical protein GN244_ATG06535 [Phytophthora infestans]|uniref:Uncharacterized protein n=1 Tax=Phytophthora infestans TaxID=4787 RepID=A0A833SXF8_PHYIN|nr:hypothetical protein GN244_ATG06535 [Phytophthora infestans]
MTVCCNKNDTDEYSKAGTYCDTGEFSDATEYDDSFPANDGADVYDGADVTEYGDSFDEYDRMSGGRNCGQAGRRSCHERTVLTKCGIWRLTVLKDSKYVPSVSEFEGYGERPDGMRPETVSL